MQAPPRVLIALSVGSHPSYGSSFWDAVARASRTPRWKLAIRLRIVSADRTGGVLSVSAPALLPTDPGTRLALGVRFGSPAVVVSSDSGAAATRAARYPSSAGEFQVCAAAPAAAGEAEAEAELSEALPLRRNQSDSSESKIGSRWSVVPPTAGGIVTWLPSEPPTPLPAPGGVIGIGPEAAEPPSPPRAGSRVVPKSLAAAKSSPPPPPKREPPPLALPARAEWVVAGRAHRQRTARGAGRGARAVGAVPAAAVRARAAVGEASAVGAVADGAGTAEGPEAAGAVPVTAVPVTAVLNNSKNINYI